MAKVEDEITLLRKENRRLKKTLEFKNNNIHLLNLINENMRAALRTSETYYVVLTAVTSQPGLGFNRAALFIREKDEVRGVMAISPNDSNQARRFYEEVAKKKFDFSFYIDQFYRQNLVVKNRLNSLVTSMKITADASNILTDALNDGQIRILDKASKNSFTGIEKLGKIFSGQFIVAPIKTRDETLGVIIADNFLTKKKITADAILSAQTLSDFAASIIMIARKYEETAELSIVDELTQLYNFRYFETRMHDEVNRCKRYKRGFSLLLIDIDHFKNFNDKNGHLTGNKALKDLAAVIRGSIRSVDIACRYGGEEFAIILPETNRKGAICAAKKLLERVRAHDFIGAATQPGGRFSVSGGISIFPDDGDYEPLVNRADQKLYMAKAAGKDRIL